jgi:hypothetical protein
MVKLRFNLVLVAEIMKTPKNLVKESCTPSLPIPGVKMNYSALGELGWTNQTTALHQGRTKILTCVPEEMRLWRHARWRALWPHSRGRRRTSHPFEDTRHKFSHRSLHHVGGCILPQTDLLLCRGEEERDGILSARWHWPRPNKDQGLCQATFHLVPNGKP